MNKIIAGALSAVLLSGVAGITLGDDDDDRGGTEQRWGTLVPVVNERYRTECGGCHFAYQPGLLPAQDWGRVMGSLANHFGDDASLDPAVAKELLDYLITNSSDGGSSLRSIAVEAPATAPAVNLPRITQTTYFQRKHDEIPTRLVTENAKVGSFSNCQACHQGAEQANFDEDAVSIPGAPNWKD
ncbi:diheme cytochrome c [uncultured Thiodictyon sp.]|uniref:diheme cytochrome c n=1 Tax=uncultured Thiodictyon sp. TaxID=1846217 RepID=UPI0025FF84D2|nr:diheme cytochrome c [uncultured Thiodictyon sp.]